MFFVYILKSQIDGSYYKGFSEDPIKRLKSHNNKESSYTSNKVPWDLVFIQSYESKKAALVREKKLKKYSHEQIEQLILSKLNQIGRSAG